MSDNSLKAFDSLKFHNLVDEIICYGDPVVLTINKDVPQFKCLKIYDDRIDLQFELGTFSFDLVDTENYSIDDVIESIIGFFDMRISMGNS